MSAALPRFAAGRYVAERWLGAGGSKEVFLAHDRTLDRRVVVGWVKAEVCDASERGRLREEVRALARLGGHPHVVTILDAGEEEDRPYLVTEFMVGESIAMRLERSSDRRLTISTALRVAREVTEALTHVHRNGILHRDLKPANVWMGNDGSVKLGDFGLAMFLDRPRVTTAGSIPGTPEYMSPEQALGRPLGPTSDLYALGAMLYEILTGRPPFLADTPIAVVSQHLHADPVAPSWHSSGLPPEIDGLVLALLAKSPGDRPSSAAEVGEAIRTLEEKGADALALPAESGRNPLERLARGLFVGRAEEMSRLRACVERALAGHASLALLSGDPGIGKTRTAQELCTYAGLRGALAVVGRCHEGGATPSFWPFGQILRGILDEGDAAIARLAEGEAATTLGQVLDRTQTSSAPTEEDDPELRFRLFDGVRRFLAAASRHKPLILVVDDLHWADGSSLAMLEFVVRELDLARIAIVVTYRQADLEPRGAAARCLAGLRRAQHTTQLDLRGLDPAGVRALVESTEGRAVPGPVLERIIRDTEGNPFFVQEMLRNLEEAREIDGAGAAVQSSRAALPEGVLDVIDHRLERLSDSCRKTLTVAAAMGREFDVALLDRVTGSERVATLGVLEEAEASRLVNEVPGAVGRWRFDHALVREALRDRLRTVERVDVHRRIGEALEELATGSTEPPLDELAHHYHEAALGGDADKAVEYARRAGRAANDRLAFEAAAFQFGRAFTVSALSAAADPVARCHDLIAQGEAHQRAGDREAAQDAFLRAAGMARSLRTVDPEASAKALGRAAFGLGGIWGTVGVVEQPVVDLLAEAVEAQQGDSALHARLLARLSVAYYWSNEVDRRLDLSQRSRDMADRVDDPATRIYVLDAAHFALWGPDTLHERLALANQMIALAGRHGDAPTTRGAGIFWRIIDQLEAGDMASVDHDIGAYGRLAEQWRQANYRWYAGVARAMRALLAGELEEGRRLAQESFAEGERAQGANAVLFFATQQIEISRLEGDLSPLVEPARDFVRKYPAIPAWRAALAALYADLGQQDEARVELDRLAAKSFADVPRDANFLLVGYFLAEVVWTVEDKERAALLHEMLEPYAEHNVVVGNAALCFGSVSHSLGRLAALLGRDEEAATHFERALEANRRLGARPSEARTQIAWAEALLGPGAATKERVERARSLLEAARAVGEALALPGIAKAVNEVDARAVASGVSPKGPAEAAPTAIPPMEGVLRREGEYWTLGWQGEVLRLKDALGLRYLVRLLAAPGQELFCGDLFAGAAGPRAQEPSEQPDLRVRAAMDGDAGEMLDARAKMAYRDRLRDLEEEIEDAERCNDTGRLDRARAEREALAAEISRGVGLGGRDRKAGSQKEQARLSVTRAIRSVLRKVAKENPELGEHLSATIKTGTFCCYTPDPRVPLWWRV